jgi:predicted enzyme related to lactoylglutathione lyase
MLDAPTPMTRFFRYQLRTTDVDGARAFYAAVLGDGDANIVRLHEQAIARGAPPHWLGFLDVGEVDPVATAFVARGATPLAPKWRHPEGFEAAVMRDPGGAVVALAKPLARGGGGGGASVSTASVGWHLLHTADVERAKANYRDLFGWEFKESLDLGGLGVFHPFAWEPGGSPVGSMSDVSTRPGVHPHWLFHVRVPAFEPALDAVRAGGGLVVASIAPPGGDRIAVCDDPQGAAFALIERTVA